MTESRVLEPLKEYKVKTLRRFGRDVGKGQIVFLMAMPHGNLYLSAGLVGTFCTNAQWGKDFEFIES